MKQTMLRNCNWCGEELTYRVIERILLVCKNEKDHMENAVGILQDIQEGRDGGYHSCEEPSCKKCEKRPGEYCQDDECNCGSVGNHASMQGTVK
jgi:hypothetical protein